MQKHFVDLVEVPAVPLLGIHYGSQPSDQLPFSVRIRFELYYKNLDVRICGFVNLLRPDVAKLFPCTRKLSILEANDLLLVYNLKHA